MDGWSIRTETMPDIISSIAPYSDCIHTPLTEYVCMVFVECFICVCSVRLDSYIIILVVGAQTWTARKWFMIIRSMLWLFCTFLCVVVYDICVCIYKTICTRADARYRTKYLRIQFWTTRRTTSNPIYIENL